MKISGIHQNNIVLFQFVRSKVDSSPVPVTPANQDFDIGMPVNGVEVIIVYLTGDIDLFAAVKNQLLILPVDA